MMEKMYTDFTTSLLPKIQEGLSITKDYFFDLFGRYVKYLIVMDSVYLTTSFICSVVSMVFLPILGKKLLKAMNDDDPAGVGYMFGVAALFFVSIISFFSFLSNAKNLAKDIFIPEVRVYEEITNKMHQNN